MLSNSKPRERDSSELFWTQSSPCLEATRMLSGLSSCGSTQQLKVMRKINYPCAERFGVYSHPHQYLYNMVKLLIHETYMVQVLLKTSLRVLNLWDFLSSVFVCVVLLSQRANSLGQRQWQKLNKHTAAWSISHLSSNHLTEHRDRTDAPSSHEFQLRATVPAAPQMMW